MDPTHSCFEHILETCHDAIVVVDHQGTVLKTNPVFTKILGFSEADIQGLPFYTLLHRSRTAQQNTSRNPLINFIKTQHKGLEYFLFDKQGNSVPVHLKSILIKDDNDTPVQAIGFMTPSTQAGAVEQGATSLTDSIWETQQNFEYIFEHSPDAIALSDNTGHILMANPAFSRLLDHPPEELPGKHGSEFAPKQTGTYQTTVGEEVVITDELLNVNAAKALELYEYGLVRQWEPYLVRKDNVLIPTDTTMSLLKDRHGETRGSIIIARDTTERKKAEKSLNDSHAFLQDIFRTTGDGLIVTDLYGCIVRTNKALSDMLGFDEDEIIGKHTIEMGPETEQSIQLRDRFLEQLFSTGSVKSWITDWYRKDGSLCPVESNVTLFNLHNDQASGAVGVVRDISERKQNEMDKATLEAQLQRAEKMETVGTLAGGVAHDLNNILGAIVGYPDLLLLDLPEHSPLHAPIVAIRESGERAAAVVQDLLTLARRGVKISEIINLNPIVKGFLDSTEFRALSHEHPLIQIEHRLQQDLFNIIGSPVHLSKTVMNLVVNATEAIQGSGRITIATENTYLDLPLSGYDSVQEGDYVVLSITDNGTGIDANDLKRIFEPFYTKKVMGRSGSGLGMAVVWGTAKDHNGYIDIDSHQHEGTSFKLYFPATRQLKETPEQLISLNQYMGSGETILVIDDVEVQRSIATGMLRKLDYTVTAVASGEAAIEYMRSNTVDLLLLDMIMDPGIDGLETYQKILKLHPQQKALIISGYSETERVKSALKLGAGPYVKKPYTMETIGMAIKKILKK